MRSGTFAIYNSEEYEVGRLDSGEYKLRAYNPTKEKQGFILHPSGCYIKIVPANEIQSAYEIRYIARYRGKEFPVFQEEENRVLIGSGGYGPDIIKDYSFVQVDRFEYEKWVAKNEIEQLIEMKVPVWGFTNV